MSTKLSPISIFLVLVCLASVSMAQCYLSHGCQPVDDLTYQPIATGQVFHGDGASNNGAGGWSTAYADVDQCLSCHYGTDTAPYLMTGHKNAMRKIAPGTLWGGPDGAIYPTTDSHYGSGSVYDWNANKVTVGWCTPLSVLALNGLTANDPSCKYPYYTLANSHAPAPYSTVTASTGGSRDAYYIFGGWQNYGGAANPAATKLNTVYQGGFTGGLYPDGNFSCARCHATGYGFDNWGPEPTKNTGGKVAAIPDSDMKRLPSDGYIAPGTSGTSSWFLTGVQCERCHVAGTGSGSHPWDPVEVTIKNNESATALCLECHRGENNTMANSSTGIVGSINPAVTLKTIDAGYCSDLSGSSYTTCVGNSANTWVYKPSFQHEAGTAFLNSPHARFSGSVVQNQQHSSDLSVTLSGTYHSNFSETPSDPTKNSGCTGCHDPHQSTLANVNATKPIVTQCADCHALSQTLLASVNHPAGPGTPFPTGSSVDVPGSCKICHMVAGNGVPQSHIWRINPSPSYYTYPTPAQLYQQDITAPNTATESSLLDGYQYPQAAWLDVDLACGQCHVGNDGVTNTYNLTLPPGMPGSHAYTRAQLSIFAASMHNGDPGVPRPTFSPTPGSYTSVQTVTISDSQGGATIYYTTDGSLPTVNSAVYSAPLTVSTSTSIIALAAYPGIPMSPYAYATYSINLPTAPPPAFTPSPSTYSSTVSVTLSNTAGLAMYYTTDGSTPTTNSTAYTGAITVTHNTTIKAISAGYGYLNSAVSTGNYYIQAPTPTITPASGTYTTTQNVNISDSVSAATIYYTINGGTPTTSSTACANPCTISGVSTSATIRAIASGGGYASSNVALASYTFQTASPTFSQAAGTYYTSPLSVTISDATSGATIYYSTNGLPSTSSPSCVSPCTVSITTTSVLRAFAVAPGLGSSSTSIASYTIQAQTPTFSPAAGTYKGAQNITISDTSSGVTIYYTTNGTFPSTSSPSCTSPCSLTVSTSEVVRAMATSATYSQSNNAVASYTIQ